MKIGLVTGEYPPMQGGVGAFTQELARAFHAAGHEVHVITNREARPAGGKRSPGTAREPVDIGFAQLHPRVGRWRLPSLDVVADICLRYELEVMNLQYQPAAYNMNSAAINLLPWRLRHVTTTIATFHDLRVPYLFPKAGPLRQKAVTFLAQHADGVIATNQPDASALQQLTARPLVQIPIGSNIKAYTPHAVEIAEVRGQLDLAPDDILLAYFGFLNESKGADTLLAALAQLEPRYHLVFVGGQTGASDATNAGFLEQIKAMVGQLGLDQRVHWTGFLSDGRVSAHLHAATAVVLPYKDGVSLRRGTLMAALAHGRPVITTKPHAVDPALQDNDALVLVPPEDPGQLAAAIRAVSNDPQFQANLATAARALAGSFAWPVIAARTLAFYQQVNSLRSKT